MEANLEMGESVENARVLNDDMAKEYADLRSYLRETKLVISEQDSHDIKFFSCQNHNSGYRKCSKTHYIRLDFLEQVVLRFI